MERFIQNKKRFQKIKNRKVYTKQDKLAISMTIDIKALLARVYTKRYFNGI